ncbi:binding-protein-dependent transport systems innermembrane component [Striga asiatica]|uniref:Binding-protein-dependent transport systems innermembrane component n=1 Tax=Striga asiatica TaxID=4170 RepID=A0A5A7QQC8_STRAF|nr:binding-protein-dependent transport systems innermembrane component [Striga asiatica]
MYDLSFDEYWGVKAGGCRRWLQEMMSGGSVPLGGSYQCGDLGHILRIKEGRKSASKREDVLKTIYLEEVAELHLKQPHDREKDEESKINREPNKEMHIISPCNLAAWWLLNCISSSSTPSFKAIFYDFVLQISYFAFKLLHLVESCAEPQPEVKVFVENSVDFRAKLFFDGRDCSFSLLYEVDLDLVPVLEGRFGNFDINVVIVRLHEAGYFVAEVLDFLVPFEDRLFEVAHLESHVELNFLRIAVYSLRRIVSRSSVPLRSICCQLSSSSFTVPVLAGSSSFCFSSKNVTIFLAGFLICSCSTSFTSIIVSSIIGFAGLIFLFRLHRAQLLRQVLEARACSSEIRLQARVLILDIPIQILDPLQLLLHFLHPRVQIIRVSYQTLPFILQALNLHVKLVRFIPQRVNHDRLRRDCGFETNHFINQLVYLLRQLSHRKCRSKIEALVVFFRENLVFALVSLIIIDNTTRFLLLLVFGRLFHELVLNRLQELTSRLDFLELLFGLAGRLFLLFLQNCECLLTRLKSCLGHQCSGLVIFDNSLDVKFVLQ